MQDDIGTTKNSELNVSYFIGYVTKIITKLSEQDHKNRTSLLNNQFVHMEIEPLQDQIFKWVRITDCRRFNHSSILDVISKLELMNCNWPGTKICEHSVLVYLKTAENSHEIIYDLRRIRDDPLTSEIVNFPHLKEYLSIKIEHKLTTIEIQEFIDNLLIHLSHLRSRYPKIKYTLRTIHDKIFSTNLVELDRIYTYCQLISSAITQILRMSLNMEFRNECFELLHIDHSEMTNDAITKNLLSLFYDNYRI